MVFFDEVRVAAAHVLHYFGRADYVDQLVVHQVLFSELLAYAQNVNGLAYLQNAVRLGIHRVGDVGQVAVEHRPDESSDDQYNGSIQSCKAIASNYILILVTVHIQVQTFSWILLVETPVNIVCV